MTAAPRSAAGSWERRHMILIAAAACTISVAFSIRQSFGLFVGPFSFDHGIPVSAFAFAIAIQNLVWGLGQPVAGAFSDRYGARDVVVAGSLFFIAGLVVTVFGGTAWTAVVGSGVLVGLGLSCTTFAVALGVVGRAVDPDRRAAALSLAAAGGSIGQIGVVPVAQQVIDRAGADAALLSLSLVAFVALPVAWLLSAPSTSAEKIPRATAMESARKNIAEAAQHAGYLLLTAGFFVCGFQLAFIATHLPGYLATCLLPGSLSAVALALIGAFNVVGTWGCGVLAGRFAYKHILAALYFTRGCAIAIFLFAPKNEATVLAFAVAMGLTWLGTAPMTSGLIAQIFGPRHLGTLFGFCFLSHQIGAFFGAWLGGFLFDVTGSYDLIWTLTAVAGFAAAALHVPINDRALRPA